MKNRNVKELSIVIPAKDEENSIGQVLEEINVVKKEVGGYNFEVIVVDDNSKDQTSNIALKYGATVVKNTGHSGKGNALKLGFKTANYDIIIMMDADYSHRPEDIPLFLEKIENGAGLVVGSRSLGGSDEYERIRLFGNVFLTIVP